MLAMRSNLGLFAGLMVAGVLLMGKTVRAQDDAAATAGQWSAERANQWYAGMPWLVGCNFSPSTAINQLEMWQADTFDPATIDRELGWAEDLGFTSVRVFLHNMLWEQDSKGLIDRMERFLAIADKHHIGVMFVLFDACWDPFPKLGKQRDPKPGLHNSGWVQSPPQEVLKDPGRLDSLKPYVQGVVGHFKDDKRVHVWDVYNEPDNRNNSSYGKFEPTSKGDLALNLLKKSYGWIREIKPSQPISSGVWVVPNFLDAKKLRPWEKFQLEASDVITFHAYTPLDETKRCVEALRRYGRPIICTEYMARPQGSTFDPNLAYFEQEKVGAYNWGFVAGKTNTIYPWDSWKKPYASEPPVWFHDIFRADGTAYRPEEVAYIKKVTGKTK
jgi:hypothetical protein